MARSTFPAHHDVGVALEDAADRLSGSPRGSLSDWCVALSDDCLAPKVERGFDLACDTLRPERRFVVYGGVERFPLSDDVEAVSLTELCEELSAP
jgi:uncharacterized protein